jgi:hypothetical protein
MAHIAALTAGWQRRLGGQAGPLGPVSGGSGDSPNGQPLQVELFVGGLWVDITSYVMTRDGSGKVSITRGQPNEGTQVDPGRCTFQLNNRDGRFSPRNPYGPYFGQLGRNQPLRVSVPSGNDKSYRFWGEVPAWPQSWDISGTDVWVDVQAAGILRRLGQGQTPLKSAMYRALASPSLSPQPRAYWPCEDMAASTSLASGIGGAPMVIAGTPTLFSNSDFVASDHLPVLGSASLSGAVAAYPATGSVQVRFLLSIPSTGSTDGATVCRVSTTGTAARWEVYYGTSSNGALGLRAFDTSGTLISDSSLIGFGTNGFPLRVSVELREVGSDISWSIGIDKVGQNALYFSGTLAGRSVAVAQSISITPDSNMSTVAVGHISLQDSITSIFDIGGPLIAYATEGVGSRLRRLCAEEGIYYEELVDAANDWAVTLGPQRITDLTTLLHEAAAADASLFVEAVSALGVGRRSRWSMYNQAPALALSYPGGQLAAVPTPVDDDQYTRNDITLGRVNGSSARATQSTGPLSVLAPPAGVGRYDTQVTLNIASDYDLANHAGWRLHLGTVDEARYPQISINLAHPTFVSNPGLRAQALAVRPGDRIAITSPPPWMPPDDISQLALGFTETIDHFEHRITFNCAPESPYRVAVLDDATLARLDTDGSQLTDDITATATTFNVAVISGQLWTTADVPFDATVGGERLTVTAVSGVTSPQTVTATRSVNGVTVAHHAGDDIRLFQPMILAL